MTVRLPAAVLFDLDGTLLDSEPVWDDALRQLARELGGELSAGARAATVGTNVAVSVGIVHADVGRLDADPAASGRRLVELAGERFAAGLVWLPGARELVDAVRAAGVPTALVTNTRAAAGAGRARAAARRALRRRVCGDDVRQRQAAPGAVPDGGRAARRRPGATRWRWRTRRPGPRPRTRPAARCWWCRSGCRCPPRPRRTFAASLADVGVADLAALLRRAA